MTLTETRQAIADALSAVGDFNIGIRRLENGQAFDGYVEVFRVEPGAFFGIKRVTYKAVCLTGPDANLTDSLIEQYAVALLEATYPLNPVDVSMEFAADGMIITIIMEVN